MIPRRHLLIVLMAFMWAPLVMSAEADATHEVRVLIDISGSMKQNDPKNLRAPALRLFTTLLPGDNRAGLWLFGQYVNNIVPSALADTAWKDKARAAADKINSRGQYTNMQGVLHDATWDWRRPAPGQERSLILLTDGLVDISPDAAKDKASRDDILSQQLPALAAAGVKIYTVALSAEADHALLKQLAAATGASYEQVDDADQLERLFLRLFDTVAKADTLPLTDNKVNIDASVSEATFLVFSEEGSEATRLTAPDGTAFDKATAPNNVRWYQEARYDLITITAPAAGAWQVNAQADPDNRVTVVTDLKMRTGTLPDNLANYQKYTFATHFEEQGKTLTTPELLQFIQVQLRQFSPAGGRNELTLHDDGVNGDAKAGDGVFSIVLGDSLFTGPAELVVTADGKTFQREFRKRVTVFDSPVSAAVRPLRDREHFYELTVLGYQDLIVPDSVQVTAKITAANGVVNEFKVPRISLSTWVQELDTRSAPGEYQAVVQVSGKTPRGEAIDRTLNVIRFGGVPGQVEATPEPAPAKPKAEQPASEDLEPIKPIEVAPPDAIPDPKAAPADDKAQAKAEAPQQSGGWLWPVIIGLLVMLLLAGGGVGVWLWWRKRRVLRKPASADMQTTETENDAVAAGADEPDLEFDAEPPVEIPKAAAPLPKRQDRPVIPELDELLQSDEEPPAASPPGNDDGETPRLDEIAEIPDDLLDIGGDDDEKPTNNRRTS